ncbi:hypothetical protein ACQ4PT_064448 [Festuca glaucescens]
MDADAAGIILYNLGLTGYTTIARDYNSSVVQVTTADGTVLRDYYATGLAPGILKPDVLAPGLNVLAAWPPKTTDSASTGPFNVISGTSMATPHVSGVVALLKSLHPDWSPAAIKSAILTTSDAVDNARGPILDEQHEKANACGRGAGHVNPVKAADPGLVYDITADEFAGYICWLQSTHANATSTLLDASLPCATLPKITTEQLNYPTITVPLRPTTFTVNRTGGRPACPPSGPALRTVTNVGPAESTYTAKVEAPSTLTVHVSPETLSFSKAGEKKTFSVSVIGQDLIAEGSLSWVSEKHVVRSPVVAVVRVGSPPPAPGRTSTQH